MRKIFLALMAVAAIALTGTFAGCEKDLINEPNSTKNGRDRQVLLTDSNGTNEPSSKKAPLRLVQDNQ